MTLETDLDISLLKSTDAWKLCDFIIANEDRFKTFLPVTVSKNLNPNLSELFIEEQLKLAAKNHSFLHTIKLKDSRQLIGIIYLKDVHLGKAVGEFAYALDYRFLGNGIIPFAINTLIKLYTSTLGLNTFKIITHQSNMSSIRVAEKCNFKWSRTLPHIFKPPNRAAMDMELYELHIHQS